MALTAGLPCKGTPHCCTRAWRRSRGRTASSRSSASRMTRQWSCRRARPKTTRSTPRCTTQSRCGWRALATCSASRCRGSMPGCTATGLAPVATRRPSCTRWKSRNTARCALPRHLKRLRCCKLHMRGHTQRHSQRGLSPPRWAYSHHAHRPLRRPRLCLRAASVAFTQVIARPPARPHASRQPCRYCRLASHASAGAQARLQPRALHEIGPPIAVVRKAGRAEQRAEAAAEPAPDLTDMLARLAEQRAHAQAKRDLSPSGCATGTHNVSETSSCEGARELVIQFG
jgi:hypothetical protein